MPALRFREKCSRSDFIISVSAFSVKREKMNKQIQQTLVNLPNAEKLYDETFVRITTQVVEDTTEEGSPEINFVYNISYNCHHFEGTEDDYPSGAYLWSTSNSCRAICNLTKSMIESELSDIFTAGRNTTITITSTTDAAEIQHIDYKGEFGDLRYMPAVFNDENVRISVDQKDGITKQLDTLSMQGLLSRFVGMLTDSRSFLSYPRHEYFRRILCDLLGRDVENGELP